MFKFLKRKIKKFENELEEELHLEIEKEKITKEEVKPIKIEKKHDIDKKKAIITISLIFRLKRI